MLFRTSWPLNWSDICETRSEFSAFTGRIQTTRRAPGSVGTDGREWRGHGSLEWIPSRPYRVGIEGT